MSYWAKLKTAIKDFFRLTTCRRCGEKVEVVNMKDVAYRVFCCSSCFDDIQQIKEQERIEQRTRELVREEIARKEAERIISYVEGN
jgi:hypothetical protein